MFGVLYSTCVLFPSPRKDCDIPMASVEPEDSVQTAPTRRLLFERPPNPLDRVEPPKRTRGDEDDHSAFLSAYHLDLEKVSETLKNGEECLQWNRDA